MLRVTIVALAYLAMTGMASVNAKAFGSPGCSGAQGAECTLINYWIVGQTEWIDNQKIHADWPVKIYSSRQTFRIDKA